MKFTIHSIPEFYANTKPRTNLLEEVELVNKLKHPKGYLDKLTIPGWNFCKNDTSKIRMGSDLTPRKLFNTGFIGTSVLLMDFDNKNGNLATYYKAISFFKNYKFMLYTSFNNTKNTHKFRIILPLDQFYKRYITELIRVNYPTETQKGIPILKSHFLLDDQTCFETPRYFTGPAINKNVPEDSNNPYEYKVHIQDGELFSFKPIFPMLRDHVEKQKDKVKQLEDEKEKKRKEKLQREGEFAKAGFRETSDKDIAIRYAQKELSNPTDSSYKTWRRINWFLKNVGLEDDERFRIIEPYIIDGREKEVERLVYGG
jgi:hypothetical protein